MAVSCKLRLDSNVKRKIASGEKMIRDPDEPQRVEPTPPDQAREIFCNIVPMKFRNEEFYEAFDIFGEGDVTVSRSYQQQCSQRCVGYQIRGGESPDSFKKHADTMQPVINKRNTLAHSYFTKPAADSHGKNL
jgi:hypothetical protein